MRQPPRKKPTLADEITRTLTAFDILVEEVTKRGYPLPETADRFLEIAERIAARTED